MVKRHGMTMTALCRLKFSVTNPEPQRKCEILRSMKTRDRHSGEWSENEGSEQPLHSLLSKFPMKMH